MITRHTIAAILSTTALAFSISLPAHSAINDPVLLLAMQVAGAERDAEVRQRIEAGLMTDPELREAEIAVRADDGVVTLEGKVHSADARDQAQRLVSAVPGVSMIRNELEVLPN